MIITATNGKKRLILFSDSLESLAIGQAIQWRGDNWIVIKLSPRMKEGT